ncbi:MAG: PEP-CTERM sorting domain-containing protein [Thermoguttaceae bacterium]|jgi:hypothetical protein|nr:PEP-CTERM sorting domain-containing protein [Thermoguttaceae bacterium]
MMPFYRQLTSGGLASIIVTSALVPCFAATITWTGAGDGANWTVNGNWDDDVPTSGDDVVFTSAGAYTGDLNLGGATFELNSITIGQLGDSAKDGLSDFGVLNRVLASNGSIKLGAGGLTATMVGNVDEVVHRSVSLDVNIELTGDMTIQRYTTYNASNQNRHLTFNGVISGGSVGDPLNLNVHNHAGTASDHAAIHFNNANTFVANVDLKGATVVNHAQGLGHAASTYTLHPGVYLQMRSSGALETDYDFILAPSSGSTLLARFAAGAWTINGNITGGHSSGTLDILAGSSTREIIFAGGEQSFLNRVNLRGGAKVIIAAADSSGIAWPNAGRIWLNSSNHAGSTVTTDFLLRGDFTLNQSIEVRDIANNNQVYLGQVNHGTTPFDAIFTGHINVLKSTAGVLNLMAGDGGSATFTGEINVANGFGFRKIGQGTVAVGGRVSQGQGTTTPIGTVTVEQGTLKIDSLGGTDAFFTTGIDVLSGATLGGSGSIIGGVTLTGTSAATLAPGNDAGPLVVSGDVDFGDHGVLAAAFGTTGNNRLEVGGLLDLSGTNNQLVVTGWFPGDVGLIASYGSLEGTFDVVDLSALGPRFSLVYNYQGQNQIAIIPEPATVLLLFLGALALLPRRSRRKRWL